MFPNSEETASELDCLESHDNKIVLLYQLTWVGLFSILIMHKLFKNFYMRKNILVGPSPKQLNILTTFYLSTILIFTYISI